MRHSHYSGPRQPGRRPYATVSRVGMAKQLTDERGRGRKRHWHYELWSSRSRNLVTAFATRDQALDYVRTLMDRRGVEPAERLVLVREDSSGNSDHVASGSELVGMAELNFIERAAMGRPVRVMAEAT